MDVKQLWSLQVCVAGYCSFQIRVQCRLKVGWTGQSMRAATVETSMVRSVRIVNFDGIQAFSQVHLKHNNQLVRLLSPQKWRVMNIWLLLHDDLALVCAFVVAVRTRSIIKSSVKIITLSSASSFKCNIQNQNYLLSMCQGETKNCFLCEWYFSFELDMQLGCRHLTHQFVLYFESWLLRINKAKVAKWWGEAKNWNVMGNDMARGPGL